MKRTLVLLWLSLSTVTSAFSAEINGTISEVREDSHITIHSSSELLPAAGDELTVFVEVPGIGKASVATAMVSSVENGVIVAKIDKATGTVRPGQQVVIQSDSPVRRKSKDRELSGWGDVINPAGDCAIIAREDHLDVTVPGSLHDLNSTDGLENLDAPRILQNVRGDFSLSVHVPAPELPESLEALKTAKSIAYTAGGLLVWQDSSNFLRFFRATVQKEDGSISAFAHAEYHADGKLVGEGSLKIDSRNEIWLGLARDKEQFVLTCREGRSGNWADVGLQGRPPAFDDELKAGIAVVNSTTTEIRFRFDSLSVTSEEEPGTSPDPTDLAANWGERINPSGDCEFQTDGQRLTISIPPGVHDLWSGRPDPKQRFNAPRVWRDVDGDFVATVKVSADWFKPENQQTNNGAGLIVWASEKDFIRRERQVFMYEGKPTCFLAPLHFLDDKRVGDVTLLPATTFKGRSTWMRVERSGTFLKTAISHDGETWTETGTLLINNYPTTLKVGVHAFNVAPNSFRVEFDDFTITTGNDDNAFAGMPKNTVSSSDPRDLRFPPSPNVLPGEPWLGLTANFRDDTIVVEFVHDDGPAARAGLQPEDILISIDEELVDNVFCAKYRQLVDIVRDHSIGDEIQLAFHRNGQDHAVSVTLGAMPPDGGNGRVLAAAEAGDMWAMKEIGFQYLCQNQTSSYFTKEQQDTEQGLYWFNKAIEHGCVAAVYDLGQCYEAGYGVDRDDSRAAKLFQQTRDLIGDADNALYRSATESLARMYVDGRGVPRDEARGATLFREAAEAGSARSAVELGGLYKVGKGVPRSDRLAMQWFNQAAIAGNSIAETEMGQIAYYGRGVQKNLVTARAWFERATQHEAAIAMIYLGHMYETGEGGTRDLNKARELYRRAVPTAFTQAVKAWAKFKHASLIETHGTDLGHTRAESRRMAVQFYREAAPHSDDAKQALQRLGISIEAGSSTGVSR